MEKGEKGSKVEWIAFIFLRIMDVCCWMQRKKFFYWNYQQKSIQISSQKNSCSLIGIWKISFRKGTEKKIKMLLINFKSIEISLKLTFRWDERQIQKIFYSHLNKKHAKKFLELLNGSWAIWGKDIRVMWLQRIEIQLEIIRGSTLRGTWKL